MKKLFTAIVALSSLVLCFQNCAKKLDEAVPGFNLVEKIPVGENARVVGDAYDVLPEEGAKAQSMVWVPQFSKIELDLQNDSIKQLYYKADSQGWPELNSETTCSVKEERVYQSLKTLLLKQEICKYESTIKSEDADWRLCPVYAATAADSYYFKVYVPETASHSEAEIGFYSDSSLLKNLDPNCTRSIQVFCSESQGEVMDQLVKDLTDRFDTYTDCSTATAGNLPLSE